MSHIATVFSNGDAIDTRVAPFNRNRWGKVGLLVAAWNGGQWVQMISPDTANRLQDAFAELEHRIRSDRTFDPQPVDFDNIPTTKYRRPQELEDILQNLRGPSRF